MEATVTQEKVERKTRAQALRDKVVIRLATDEAGPLIAEVLKANGIELPGADWSKVFPSWLIATVDDEVIGCLQVLPAKPVTWCEFLHVKPSAGFKMRAIALRKLMAAGMSTAFHYGSSYVAGMVDGRNQKLYEVLEHMGFTTASPHVPIVKRLK